MNAVVAARSSPLSIPALYALLLFILMVLFMASLAIGPAPLSLLELISGTRINEEILWLILTEIRLPRTLLAILVGATLGLSGAVLQGFLRNPLADPGLIGASATAALGAVLTLYTGMAAAFPLALPLGGLAGVALAVMLIYLLAGRGSSPLTLILAGVAINSLAGALTSLALNLAPSPYAALEIVFWLLGSLADRSFDQVALAAPFIILGCTLLLATGRALDALSLGEDSARSLGFNLDWVRFLVVAGTALSVGAAVSVTGTIGFIGLVVPHLLRPLAGYQPSVLLGLSALGGAVLILLADIGVRLLSTGPELKLGVVTALLGGPFFLYLLLHLRRSLP